MVEDNRKVAERFFAALNAHDVDALDRLRAADFQSQTAEVSRDSKRSRQYVEDLLIGFPDLRFQINRTIAQGDYVVVDWIAEGTHTGVLHAPSGVALPPTGRPVRVLGSHTFELKDGKITRNWFFMDAAGILAQLGLMPPM